MNSTRNAYAGATIWTAARDPWDGRNKVQATYIDGEKVFEADGPYLPA